MHRYLTGLVRPDPRWGFCHGDLHFGNVFLDEGGRPVVIDFDHGFNGHQAYDLAVHLWVLGPATFLGARARAARRRYWQAFLQGYEEVFGRDQTFRRAVEAVVPTRFFEMLSFVTQHHGQLGVRMLEPRRIQTMLYFCRVWARELELPLEGLEQLESHEAATGFTFEPFSLMNYPRRLSR